MALFRKPKKNVRPRGPLSIADVDLYDDESEDPSLAEIHNNISKLKEKKKDKDKKKREKPKDDRKVPLLSFEDDLDNADDGEEVFKIKKSSASRRLRKQKEKERKDGEFSNQSYPPPQEATSNGSNGNKPKVIDDDLDIVVVNDNVPNKSEDKGQSWTLAGKEAEALHLEEEDRSDNEDVVDVEDGYDPLKKIIEAGGIPDAVAIHAARKKREAMRARGGSEDYIPVRKSNTSANTGKRLVREEDQEEDDDERISFTVKESKKEDDYHRHAEVGAGSDSDNDHWEAQQIRKAVTQNQISYAATEKYTDISHPAGLPQPPLPPVISLASSSPVPQPPRGPPPLSRPVQYNLPGIRDRMKQRLVEMEEVSRRHQADADRAVDDLVESECEIERLEGAIPDLAAKHRFYQDLRGYVTDYVDCFDEKVGSIAYLEERLYKMYAEVRGKIRERRRQDVRDQADHLHAMTATNIALMMDPVQDAVRDFRVAEREGRRMRRRQARQARNEMRHNDGMSSDDEMPSTDKASLAKVRQDVENQARQVLDDVIEEFALLSNVQTRLSSWKLEEPSSYKEAYVSLCLPKLFSPLIRMQLLLWNPFVHEQKIEDQEWYRTLATYGLHHEESIQTLAEDPDRKLLSNCVEKVLLPKLLGLVRSGYDPVSTSQTLRLVAVVSRLASDYPTLTATSKHFRQLMSVVIENIKESLDSDVYIPMYNKNQLDGASSPHATFAHRQFWSTLKLLRNILAWQGVLADGVLAELAIDRLLNRYVLLSLRANPDISDAIDKSRQVVALFPPWWLTKGEAGELARLSMFIKFLATAGATSSLPRDAVLEAARILKLLGEAQTSETLRELL